MTWVRYPLNIEKMQEAAQYFIGEHDFSSFRAADCQAHSPLRNVQKAELTVDKPVLVFEVKANAFLHHMVRNMIGVLIAIGRGHHEPTWVLDLLELKDRSKAGVTALPDGLYLVEVDYPKGGVELPPPGHGAFFL